MTRPERITTAIFALERDGDADAREITRQATCHCGTLFAQSALSLNFLEKIEQLGAIRAMDRELPGYWCPKFCPRCERLDLAREARCTAMHQASEAA